MPSQIDKAFEKFIDDMPLEKLETFPDFKKTLYETEDFVLKARGLTTEEPKKVNIYIVMNKHAKISTMRGLNMAKSQVLCEIDNLPKPEEIKKQLKVNKVK
ncbi:hypothetical protein MMC21_003771 [Puttea exsequens]|nr:hypothetical protein [Puttea exsequens]